MLSTTSLNYGYGNKPVLHNVDLSLSSGELVGIIGPNGSGKTTLIRCLSGVLTPIAGTVTLAGKKLDNFSDQERARKIAVVPQSAQLPPACTVFECVSLGRTPHLGWLGHLGDRDLQIIGQAMQVCEIQHFSDRRISSLSGGEQQRVLLARALTQDCPVLLLDEPTAHLDLHHQVALLNLIRQMSHERSLAVLVAIHDLNLASLYADRLVLILEGRIHASGTPAEVLTRENLQNAYQIPLQVHPNPQNGVPWVVLERS